MEINEQLNTNDASKVSKIIDTVTTGIGNMVAAVEDLFIDFLNLLSTIANATHLFVFIQ